MGRPVLDTPKNGGPVSLELRFSAANTSLAAILSEQVFNNEKKNAH